ncbi:MAG: Minf_1886 family protein [Candidatus Anammoxibacter sp.]
MADIENIYEKLRDILENDKRYSLYAYQFVFEGLSYTAKTLGKDTNSPHDEERHINGRQLLEGIRAYALEEYGYMANLMFKFWGVKNDADFGEIVFNLVENGLMGKTETDSRDDFKDVYDFKAAFDDGFKFEKEFNIKMQWDRAGKAKIK